MTIRIISDREVTLQMQIEVQSKVLQKTMNETIAQTKRIAELEVEVTSLRSESAHHLREYKAARGKLHKAQAAIEASRKQEPVATYIGDCSYGDLIAISDDLRKGAKLYAAPVIADDAQRDARRYQWLREYLPSTDMSVDDDLVAALNPQDVDVAIDAAMKGTV